MDLSPQSRELIDLAADVGGAPLRARELGRQRLLGAIAVGTVTTSTVAAKGAMLAAKAAGTVGTAASVTKVSGVLLSAILIGFSTGLVCLSPATNPVESRPSLGAATLRGTPNAQIEARRRAVTEVHSESNTHEVAPERAVAAKESLSAAPRRLEPGLAVAAPSRPTKASIARETQLLAEVQRALKAGDPGRALEALNRYNEECPAGQLHEEATASRVVALCGAGRVQDGRRWAEEFARRYPSSPLLPRVNGACPKSNAVPSPENRE